MHKCSVQAKGRPEPRVDSKSNFPWLYRQGRTFPDMDAVSARLAEILHRCNT
jgi:hypothetical protein